MSLFYKKNEFERKSTQERYRIERGELYFRKKSGNTGPILFAFAAVCALYAFWGGGRMYYLVAAIFAGLAVWQLIYVRGADVSAEEADERAEALRRSLNLEVDALNASDLDYDAFMDAEKIQVWGYTTLPIAGGKPLLRADSADETGRSSHIQFTVFTLAEESLEAYSVIRSLLGNEKEETIMEWKYGRLRQVGFERIAADCAVEAGSQKTETRKFPVLSVRSSNKKENRTYAIGEDCRGKAEKLLRRLQEKQTQQERN